MKNKGFTLIELLAVISILALIAVIVFPAINSAIKNAREKAYNDQIAIIEKAAKEWAIDNVNDLPDKSGDSTYISVDDLQNDGYISEDDVLDPRNNEHLTGGVKITYESKQYTYEYDDEYDEDETAASWILENASDKATLKANDGVYKGENAKNYLTFSGKTWRILNVNSNGTIKAIMSDDVTSLPFDSNGTSNFSNSTVYTYLNNTFLNTLNKSDIVKSNYCAGDVNSFCNDTISALVSLPSVKDYVEASNKPGCAINNNLCKEGTYLNFSNTCLSNSNNSGVYTVSDGTIGLSSPISNCNIRPVITLSSKVNLEGSGTRQNPFVVI